MHAPFYAASGRSLVVALVATFVPVVLLAACGGSSGGGGQSGIPGELAVKPDGSPYFIDPNQSGSATDFHLAEVRWGRLVDVFDVDALGVRGSTPVFRDYVIDPSLTTNPALGYRLDRNPATQRERLTIANPFGPDPSDPVGEDLFVLRLESASALPLALAKDDDGSSPPPFTLVPRNACVVLRFDDCLRDDTEAISNIATNVRVSAGYPPTTPFQARLLFDPNHGAQVGAGFHSTRILIDMAVSAQEEAESNLVANAAGLPASQTSTQTTNVSVRIPTQIDIGTSQFTTLTNLSGTPLDFLENGPNDPTRLTMDIVRALRSGNSQEPAASNGYLADADQPRLVGAWVVDVTSQTPVGADSIDFLLDLTFQNVCQADARVGDVIEVGGAFLEVTVAGTRTGSTLIDLLVRSVEPLVDDGDPLTDDVLPDDLIDVGLYQAPFDPTLPLSPACWVTFLPGPSAPPSDGVLTTAQVAVRFSEPMDPTSLSPFRGFTLVNDEPSGTITTPNSQNTVVGSIVNDGDLRTFTFDATPAFAHVNGNASAFHVAIGDVRDLGGRALLDPIVPIPFTIDPFAATQETDAIVLRFDTATNDEYEPNGDPGAVGDGLPDLRGQFFLQTTRGVLRGRAVATSGWPVDRTRLVPSRMIPFTSGFFVPLTELGAKLQTVWRHCDVGWHPTDETKTNLDVIGLNWSPVGGLVMNDFYDLFEIRLGHSRFLPDEGCCPTMTPTGGTSGLPPGPAPFEDNFLAGSNPIVVHNRALGYSVSVSDIFSTPQGTALIPFPMNRGAGQDVTYTWRDTAILAQGADGDPTQPGFPLGAEVGTPNLPAPGSLGMAGEVPSYGLPLLIEIKCFPSDRGLGLNRFDVNIGTLTGISVPIPVIPGFRAYSAGGSNGLSDQVVLPDSETVPRGAVNPGGNTPSSDSIFYLGQLDTIVRVSRVHSVWLDAGLNVQPQWRTPIQEPPSQPTGASVQLDFRSATGFTGMNPSTSPFDASRLDPYGDAIDSGDFSPQNPTDWSNQIVIGNGQRYLQVRVSFVNNIATGVGPELSALALPYDF
ncbi:MAG TPA: Ig-like domain-containing protein [Planctomycetota bacterium]